MAAQCDCAILLTDLFVTLKCYRVLFGIDQHHNPRDGTLCVRAHFGCPY